MSVLNFYVYTKGDPVNRTGLYDIGWGDYVPTPDRAGGESSVADYIHNLREIISYANTLGVCLARKYIAYYDNPETSWGKARYDRYLSNTYSEELRNAEHYLWAYYQVKTGGTNWFFMITQTFGYSVYKKMYNIFGSKRFKKATFNELGAGLAGANDALVGFDMCECGCECVE